MWTDENGFECDDVIHTTRAVCAFSVREAIPSFPIVLAFSCGRAKTIQMRYMWLCIFLWIRAEKRIPIMSIRPLQWSEQRVTIGFSWSGISLTLSPGFGILSKMGSRFGIESMQGMYDVENNHRVYGIEGKFVSEWRDWAVHVNSLNVLQRFRWPVKFATFEFATYIFVSLPIG